MVLLSFVVAGTLVLYWDTCFNEISGLNLICTDVVVPTCAYPIFGMNSILGDNSGGGSTKTRLIYNNRIGLETR